jgi:hypothetical protein
MQRKGSPLVLVRVRVRLEDYAALQDGVSHLEVLAVTLRLIVIARGGRHGVGYPLSKEVGCCTVR